MIVRHENESFIKNGSCCAQDTPPVIPSHCTGPILPTSAAFVEYIGRWSALDIPLLT